MSNVLDWQLYKNKVTMFRMYYIAFIIVLHKLDIQDRTSKKLNSYKALKRFYLNNSDLYG